MADSCSVLGRANNFCSGGNLDDSGSSGEELPETESGDGVESPAKRPNLFIKKWQLNNKEKISERDLRDFLALF